MKENHLITDFTTLNFLKEKEIKFLNKIYSPHVGIINAILQRYELKDYGYFMFQSLSSKAKVVFDLPREVSSGGLGVSKRIENAFWACIAESLERYCMSYSPENELLFDTYSNLPKGHKLKDYFLYTKKQYKENLSFKNPRRDMVYWTKLKDYFNPGNFIYLPASMVYLPFKYDKSVVETTSTGMATARTIDNTVLNGVLELIERDAIMINFLNELPVVEIDPKSIKDDNELLIKKISKEKKLKIYKLYTDLNVPVYLCFVYSKYKKGFWYGIGAGAKLNSDKALESALKECLFSNFYARNIIDLRPNTKSEIKSLHEHFLYYQGKNFKQLLFKTKNVKKYSKFNLDKNKFFKLLQDSGYEVFYKDITSPDIAFTNLKVVRSWIPGLVDLNKSYGLRRLGARRIWTLPKKLGLKSKKELNSNPHPFP